MSVGTLFATAVLDEPHKIYCGNKEPVLGHVHIRFVRGPENLQDTLFGPLRVSVTLHGRSKAKIWKSNGSTTSIYRGRAPLFSHNVLIYDDAFRMRAGETKRIPFSLDFPALTDAVISDTFLDEPGYICHRSQPLPPSFHNHYSGFAHHYKAFVEYRVGVDAVMPDLQVHIYKPVKNMEPLVHYERPGPPKPPTARLFDLRSPISISNELLLPESQRPTGFREKTKALFGAAHFPTYAFGWICLAPQDLHIGQPMRFEIRIRPLEDQCTASIVPEIRLKSLSVEIKAYTRVRATKTIFSSPSSKGDYTVFGQMCIYRGSPFFKADEYTKIVDTQVLECAKIDSFCSSFATHNISQSYVARVNVQLEVSGKIKLMEGEYPVIVHPRLQAPVGPPTAIAGSSSGPTNAGTSSGPANTENEELPPYEPAPGYDEVVNGKK